MNEKLDVFAVAVGVNANIYDKKILDRFAGSYFIEQYKKIKPIIDLKMVIARLNYTQN